MKKIILIVLILALAGGLYFYFKNGTGGEMSVDRKDITWTFETKDASDGAPNPRTNVIMHLSDKNYNVGIFDGSCAQVPSSELLKDEVDGVFCWWTAGNIELGVFNENGKFVMKKGKVQEGTAETKESRDGFEVMFEVI